MTLVSGDIRFMRIFAGLEDFVLGMGTSVASALTAETVFEIIKCMSDVDMPARVRMGSKSEILRVKIRNFEVFQFWLRPR